MSDVSASSAAPHPFPSPAPSTPASPAIASPAPGAVAALSPWAMTLLLVGALTAARVALLFVSRLELYPDEAQYWLWSRRLTFGYFSKPPAIAWLIAATTGLGGDAEPWVRLSAPLLHGVAALALARAATRLYDARTGLWTAAVYALMPGVQLSSQVIATDAPLLAALALALWAIAAMWTTPRSRGTVAAAALGLALGAAVLSKYAGLYAVAGLALHAASSRAGRARLWSGRRLAATVAVFLAVISPNVAWNLANHLQTVTHTVADADLGGGGREGASTATAAALRGPPGFLLGQFGVFGPAPFAVLLGICGAAARRRQLEPADALLLWLTLPPLAVVLVEAALVRANTNWAAAAYVGGAPLVAATLRRWGARGRATLAGGLALQAVAIAGMALIASSPAVAHALGADNSLKRARGWRATAQAVHAHAREVAEGGPVTAIAVDDRFLFNALGYYGRDWLTAPGAPPLRMWVHEAQAHNQAEAASPLTAADGVRVAFASVAYPQESRWDFRRVSREHAAAVTLDARRRRDLLLFVGQGFAPRPRDPVTGVPVPPR